MNEIVKQRILSGGLPTEVKLYIMCDAGTWVDFSDRCERGRNGLVDIGTLELSGEYSHGQFNTSDLSVTVLQGQDRFWNKAPSRLTDLYDVNGDAAVFTDFYNKKAKVSCVFDCGGITIEEDLNTYLIDKLSPGQSDSGTAVLTLTGLQKLLREVPANTVKNGKQWYRQRPMLYMLRRLLEKVHTAVEIATFTNIATAIEIQNQIIVNGSTDDYRALSWAARPPYQDSVGNWRDAEYYSEYTRVLLLDQNDNNIIYHGINQELYKYHVDLDYYEKVSNNELGAGYNIQRLWYNITDDKIWGVAWNDPADSEYKSNLKIFEWQDGYAGLVVKSPTDADSSLLGVFPGNYCYRRGSEYNIGAPYGTVFGIGQTNIQPIDKDVHCGENILYAINHKITFINNAGHPVALKMDENTLFYKTTSDLNTDFIYTSPVNVTTGYNSIVTVLYWPARLGLRFTLGQQGFCIYNSTANVIVFASLNSATDPTEWYLYKYDIATNTVSKIMDFKEPTTLRWLQPTCGSSDSSDDKIYIGSMDWKDTGTDKSIAYIHALDISAGTLTKWHDASADVGHEYFTPLEIVSLDGGTLYVSLLRRDTFHDTSTANKYYFATHNNFPINSFVQLSTGNLYQYKGICSAFPQDPVFVECQTGKFKKYSAGTISDMDTLMTVGDIDFNICSNIISRYDSTLAEYQYWMVSAPDYPNEFHTTAKAGLYQLVKYSKMIFPYRSLYYLEDWNCKDAIDKIANFCDYLWNYDASGKFFFIKRPTSGTPSINYKNTPGQKYLQNIILSDFYEDIFNCVSITPYSNILDKVEQMVELTADSTWDENPTNGNQIVNSVSTLDAFNIILIATNDSNYFKWINTYAQIETQLSQTAAVGATRLYIGLEQSIIGDTTQLADGDLVQFQDTNNQTVYRTITARSVANKYIDIDSGIPLELAECSPIIILKSTQNTWTENLLLSSNFQQIGSTGVYIKMAYAPATGYNFSKGDKIILKSNGLISKAMEQSPQSAFNTTSIASYGKRYYDKIDNRFFDRRMALNMATKIIQDYPLPKFGGHIAGAYLGNAIGDVTGMYDANSFPDEKENFVKAYLNKIRIDTKTLMAELYFRALNSRQL